MKQRLFTSLLMAAFLLGLVSCQREQLGNEIAKPFKITAQIQEITRVTYSVDNAENTIKPSWVAGDKIFGFDDRGVKFTFTVETVENGVATLAAGGYEPEAEATKLYAIYYPGKGVDDIEDNTLEVDLSAQTGAALDGESPVLMCATAPIVEGGASLSFTNETAIVGLKRIKVGANDQITSVKVTGVVTGGEFRIVDGELALVPTTEAGQIEVDIPTPIVADASGIIGTETVPALMFVALPKASSEISFLATTTESKDYFSLTNLRGDILPGNYYYADKALSSPVAQIGSTYYFGLVDAFNDANKASEDVTITMLSDVTITSQMQVNNAAGKTITLDLNDCTISGSLTDKAILVVSSSLVVDDGINGTGAIINTKDSDDSRAMYLKDVTTLNYKLVVNGGTFKSHSNSVVYCQADEVEINGGSFINQRSAGGNAFYMFLAAAKVTVNGGNFVDVNGGKGIAFRSGSSTVTINGGYFHNGESTADVVALETTNNNTRIKGGYFSKAPAAKLLESGYEVSDSSEKKTIDGTDYTFTKEVKESTTVVARIGAVEYYSILDAFAAANQSATECTITLWADIPLRDSLIINNSEGKEVTFDFNGYDITSTAGAGMIRPYTNCTITNSGTSEKGGISNSSSYALWSSSAEVEVKITGGKYIGANEYGAIRFYGKNAKMTISGDTYVLNSKSGTGYGINVGGTESTSAVLTIEGGTFESNTASALRNRYGETKVTGGLFIGAKSAVEAASSRGTLIENGYFYSNDSESDIITGTGVEGRVKGGYFNKPVDSKYCVSGYATAEVVPAETYKNLEFGYQVKESTDVPDIAMIGTTGYKTLASAFKAANESTASCTLKLLDDIISDIDVLELANANEVTVDMNGKTLTGRIQVGGRCKFTGNGTLKVPNSNDGFLIKVLSGASLTIENGTFQGTTASGSNKYCIWGYGASGNRATIVVNGGTISAQTEMGTIRAYYTDVTVNGGTLNATGKFPRTLSSGESGKFKITGGTLNGSNAVWRCSSKTEAEMEITGGTFIAKRYNDTDYNGIFYLSSKAAKLTISGGAFWSDNGIVGKDDAAGANATNLSITGGKFSKNASTSLPASRGYEWKAIEPADGTTIPDKSLTYEVVKAQ